MSEQQAPVIGQDSTIETPKHAGGRPRKLTVDEQLEVYNAFEQFITDKDDPRITNFISVNEVALKYKVTKDNMYDWPEFSELRKRAIDKQEDYLLENGGNNKYNPTIAIFRLKQPQHGYKDRTETDITSKNEALGHLAFTPEQADQLLKLRASERADSSS